MNNFEKIKQMDIDKLSMVLANWIECNSCPIQHLCIADENGCNGYLKRWLESEAIE